VSSSQRSTNRPADRERPVRGPNAERQARTHAALLVAARRVFSRDGFASATTGEIMAGTGLTRGALYYHFPDKLALFDAVVEQVAGELVVRIGRVVGSMPDAFSRLRAGCEEWLRAMADPELHRLYLVEAPAALGLPRWREIDAAYGGGSLRGGIQAVLAERGDSEPDLESLTALLSGALNEAALWIADADDQAAAGRAMRRSLDTLLGRLFSRAAAGPTGPGRGRGAPPG
jgi:AcrR family transcriptional regulator